MDREMDAEHLCDVIKNLRLFTNTEREWKEKYGSYYKSGKKDQLLELLNAQCQKAYDGLNLYELMNWYSKSAKDEFIDKHRRDVIFTNEAHLLSLVRYYCMKDSPMPENLTGRSDVEEFLDCDPALLILWSVHDKHGKALPFFDERQGDVDIDSYSFIISELRRILPGLFPKKTLVDGTPPVIISEFRKINLKLCKHTIIRMDLVSLVINVLANVIVHNDKEELYYINKEIIAHHALSLDVCGEEEWWVNPDEAPVRHLYKFQECGISYLLSCYDLSTRRYIGYTVSFFQDQNSSCAIFQTPQTVMNLVKNEPLSEGTFMYCYFRTDTEGVHPDTISFIPYAGRISTLPPALKRMGKYVDSRISELDDYENEYQDYEYDTRSVERLISADYLFVERESVILENGLRKVTSWYRVPRYANPKWNLDQILPEDDIFLMHLFGEDYIFFSMLNLSLKVTTIQDCIDSNIDVMTVPSYEF